MQRQPLIARTRAGVWAWCCTARCRAGRSVRTCCWPSKEESSQPAPDPPNHCRAQKRGREFDVRGRFTFLVGKERYGGKTFGNSRLR
eukprot:389944-Rhodomonas_salina.1